ncbi:hypothetical protein D3C81_2188300 [compost metagenome]
MVSSTFRPSIGTSFQARLQLASSTLGVIFRRYCLIFPIGSLSVTSTSEAPPPAAVTLILSTLGMNCG